MSVSVSGLPKGISASPATMTLLPGQLGQWTMQASGAAVTSTVLTVTGTSGSLVSSLDATLSVAPALANANLSVASYHFAGTLVGTTLTRAVAVVSNTGVGILTLHPTLAGDASFSLSATSSCKATLAPGASCTEHVMYSPTVASGSTSQTAILKMGLGNVPVGTEETVALAGTAAVLSPGTVTATNNPQVALYSLTLPFPGSVTVSFGPTTAYGRQTWTQTTTTSGTTIKTLVAGMLPNSSYHLQATYTMANGLSANDSDHSFTTGAPLFLPPTLTATTTPGLTPQAGVEQMTFVSGGHGVLVTDLASNLLWTYTPPANEPSYVQGAKLLPDGHFLVDIGLSSGDPLAPAGPAANTVIAIREIDLAGDIVREITPADLTNELKATGYNLTLQEFHHDVTPLPNGHWLILPNVLPELGSEGRLPRWRRYGQHPLAPWRGWRLRPGGRHRSNELALCAALPVVVFS